MKRYLLIFLFPFIFTSFLSAEELVLDSKIEAVTLYKRQASIKRLAKGEFEKGVKTVLIRDLPNSILKSTVRAEVLSNTAKIISFKIIQEYEKIEEENNEMEEIIKKIKSLKQEKEEINDRIHTLTSQKDYIRTVSNNISQKIRHEKSKVDTGTIQFTYNFSMEKMDFVKSEIRELRYRRDEIYSQIKEFQKRKNTLKVVSRKEFQKNIEIKFEVLQPQELTLEISYNLARVSWYPSYDIYVADDEEKIAFKFSANVSQNTGEDWKDIDLTISANNPTIDMNIPEFYTWIIDYKKKQKGGFRDRGYQAELPSKSTIKPKSNLQKSTQKAELDGFTSQQLKQKYFQKQGIENVKTSDKTSLQNYELKHKTTVLSYNQKQKINVLTEIMDIKTKRYVIPRLSQKAYIKAEMINKTDLAFLSGKANVYFGNTFVTSVNIPRFLPSQKIEFSLGSDNDILVDFERLEKEKDIRGLFSKKNVVNLGYRITVNNYNKDRTAFEIVDQVPTANNKDIDITITDSKPNYVERTEDDVRKGKIKWIEELEPEEKFKIDYYYEIDIPADVEIDF